jgi:hypothetical protein
MNIRHCLQSEFTTNFKCKNNSRLIIFISESSDPNLEKAMKYFTDEEFLTVIRCRKYKVDAAIESVSFRGMRF